MTTTTTEPRTPAYTVRKNEDGLTAREQEFQELYDEGLTGSQIAEKMGVNKQRVSEIKLKLKAEGKLREPRQMDRLTKSEWRAMSAALRKLAADGTSQPVKDSATRALEKGRQLLPKGVNW